MVPSARALPWAHPCFCMESTQLQRSPDDHCPVSQIHGSSTVPARPFLRLPFGLGESKRKMTGARLSHTWDSYTSSCPPVCPTARDKPSPCFFVLFPAFNLKQMIAVGRGGGWGGSKKHYHLGEASGVLKEKKQGKKGSMGKFIFPCYNQSLT